MAARIVVQSGISSGASYWIERNVVRVGSDPTSDMVIPSPSVDPHALTVEFRQTEYRVYNRGSQQIVVGGQLLEQGQYTNWLDTDLLQMQGDVTLALELDADPSPTPKPIFDASDTLATPVTAHQEPANTPPVAHASQRRAASSLTAEASPGLSKTTVQLAVTGLCIVGCVLLLARHQLRGGVQDRIPAPELEEVVRSSLESDDSAASSLVDQLQLAEAAYIRGQKPLARERFRQLHDALKASSASELAVSSAAQSSEQSLSPSDTNHPPSSIASPSHMMQKFVNSRLQKIGAD